MKTMRVTEEEEKILIERRTKTMKGKCDPSDSSLCGVCGGKGWHTSRDYSGGRISYEHYRCQECGNRWTITDSTN